MFESADPCDCPFESHAEATVWDSAVFAQVQIPLEGLLGKVMFVQTRTQQCQIVNALSSADDLTISFWRQYIHTEGKVRPHLVGLHVKGFERCGIPMDDEGSVE